MFLFWLKFPNGSSSAWEKQILLMSSKALCIWPPANSLVFLPPAGHLGLLIVPWTESHVSILNSSHLCVLCPRDSFSIYLHFHNSSHFPLQVLFNCCSQWGFPRASFIQSWNPSPILDSLPSSPVSFFLHPTYCLPIYNFLLFISFCLPPLNAGS